jgi:flagellar biosynthesis/type III secretory pathway protein FliH
MKRKLGSALIAFAFVFGIIATASTTADAQWSNRSYGGYNNQELQQGFQYGANVGASDAQRGQSYGPQRSRYYRDARTQAFRDGFVRGYDEAYRQYAGAYGNGSYRNRGRNSGYNNQELNAGYQQGLNTGASDGQSNKSYSPQRSKHYRNASTQAFREGFVRGYDEGYRQYSGNGNYRRSNSAASVLQQIFGIP